MSVIVVGSANIDVLVSSDRLPSPGETVFGDSVQENFGGKGLNQAVAASRTGSIVDFFFTVGKDAAGRNIISFLEKESLNSHPLQSEKETGRAMIQIDSYGENSITVIPGANMEMQPLLEESISGAIKQAFFIILQAEINPSVNLEVARLAKKHGVSVVLIPAPVEKVSEELLAVSDVLILNEHECAILGKGSELSLSAKTLSSGRTLILTLGAKGAELYKAGQLVSSFASPVVEAVDTTGAGDCFAGSYISSRALGYDEESAIEFAVTAASLSVQKKGAAESMPSLEEVMTRIGELNAEGN
jgi:ribokinase